ncbi:MAG: NAD(P)-binding domain-containing protein, partial [Candidatus Margulisiibacteriota bacterium]|nr:NAD(P)-binding domain-containing protein [Candidatus Margulisiibacteriota bacterium]
MSTNTLTFELIKTNIQTKQFTMGVVGLGYVGLPLVCEFIESNINVVGFDISDDKVNKLNQGQSYIQDISNEKVQECVDSGRFEATTDFSKLSTVDVISICVPTPLRKTKDPDMSFVVAAVKSISDHLKPGQLIILESTTYPGTTEELMQPIFEEKGFTIGHDLYLA